jgi:tRNA-splicing ligase RtcB
MISLFTPKGSEPDPKAVAQIEMCMRDDRAVAGALMADHHLGYSMPIGGVVAYQDAISPSGVGFDIACGNKAVRTPLLATDLGDAGHLRLIMEEIQRTVAFGMGRSNPEPVDHPLFYEHAPILRELDSLVGGRQGLSQKARAQLGTVGSGNHYVDLLADEYGYVWVANHFGSRGLGHTIAKGFLNLAVALDFESRAPEREEPTVFSTSSELGQSYLAAMELAGAYAYAGRDYVIDQVLSILGTTANLSVHNHHNYAWNENGLWVIRKGATPLTSDLAFIGGSMGDGAVVVCGRVDTHTLPRYWAVSDIGALGSAPHGAGRVMSRTKAAGRFKKVPVERKGPDGPYTKMIRVRDASTGAVDWPRVKAGLADRGIVVLGSGADEAPEVYKNLDSVLAAHSNIEIVHRLRPLGIVMAGDDVYDPYKD